MSRDKVDKETFEQIAKLCIYSENAIDSLTSSDTALLKVAENLFEPCFYQLIKFSEEVTVLLSEFLQKRHEIESTLEPVDRKVALRELIKTYSIYIDVEVKKIFNAVYKFYDEAEDNLILAKKTVERLAGEKQITPAKGWIKPEVIDIDGDRGSPGITQSKFIKLSSILGKEYGGELVMNVIEMGTHVALIAKKLHRIYDLGNPRISIATLHPKRLLRVESGDL